MKHDIILNFDINEIVQSNMIFKQGDSGLTFRIILEGNYSSGITRIIFKKPDQTIIESLLQITDSANIFEHTLTGKELQEVGKVVADVKIYSKDGRVSTASFIFNVVGDTLTEHVKSESYSDTLQQAEKALEETRQELTNTVDSISQAYSSATEALNTATSVQNKLEILKETADSLDTNFLEFDKSMNNTKRAVEELAYTTKKNTEESERYYEESKVVVEQIRNELESGNLIGRQGEQGIQGEKGLSGRDGVVVDIKGNFGFQVDTDGHLYCVHPDNSIPPSMYIDNNGHLIMEV